MQKRVLFLIVGIMLINLASAQSFSLTDFLDSLNSESTLLVLLFFIFFAVIYFALSRFFKDRTTGQPNKGISGVISFCISFLAVFGLYKTGIDVEGLFLGVGISSELLYTIVPIFLIAITIYLIFTFKSKVFLILGILFLAITIFTDWVYEEGTLNVIAGVLIVIGIIWWAVSKKKHGLGGSGGSNPGMLSRGASFVKNKYKQSKEIKKQKKYIQKEMKTVLKDYLKIGRKLRQARGGSEAAVLQQEMLRLRQYHRALQEQLRRLG